MRDAETEERLFVLESSDYPHHSKVAPRRAVMDRILKVGDYGDSREPIALERYPDQIRLELIGQNCQIHGRDWMRRNAEELEWLKEQGSSVERAITAYRGKLDALQEDRFFEPATLACPKCKYRGRTKKKKGGKKFIPAFDRSQDQPACRKCGYVLKYERLSFHDGK